MSYKFSTLKERFTKLTPEQRKTFIELIEAYLDCAYKDFAEIAERLKWERIEIANN